MCEHTFVALNPNLKGNVAEAAIAFRALQAGIEVLRPQGEHVRYDLAFDFMGRILRVQCKSAMRKGETITVRLMSNRRGPDGFIRRRYTREEIDLVAAYCEELDRCYVIPIDIVEGTTALCLRLRPARNGQRAAINFAADYEFPGAVAQLEEHLNGIQGVTGSSPVSSIPAGSPPCPVGAEAFGMHPARFLQRAAAGEEFLISRRGRPMARLVPAGG